MRVFVVTPPEPVVSLDEAKEHLRVDGPDEDALITSYVAAATSHIDGPDAWLGRAIGVQTLEMRLPAFGTCGWIILPYRPAIEMVSVTYLDEDGGTVTLDPSQYDLSDSMLRPAWPSTFPSAAWRGPVGETVRLQWKAGYATLPPAIRAAILLMVGDLYENRETTVVQTSTTVENLLASFRVYA